MNTDTIEILSQMKSLVKDKIKPIPAKISQLINRVKDKHAAMETLTKQIDQVGLSNKKELEDQIVFMSREIVSMLLEIRVLLLEIRVLQDQQHKFSNELEASVKKLSFMMTADEVYQ